MPVGAEDENFDCYSFMPVGGEDKTLDCYCFHAFFLNEKINFHHALLKKRKIKKQKV